MKRCHLKIDLKTKFSWIINSCWKWYYIFWYFLDWNIHAYQHNVKFMGVTKCPGSNTMSSIIFVPCALLFCTYIFHLGVVTILMDGFEESYGYTVFKFRVSLGLFQISVCPIPNKLKFLAKNYTLSHCDIFLIVYMYTCISFIKLKNELEICLYSSDCQYTSFKWLNVTCFPIKTHHGWTHGWSRQSLKLST